MGMMLGIYQHFNRVTSFAVFVILLFLHIVLVRPEIVIKSASLTPMASGYNGANVLTHIDEVSTVNNNQQWRIATNLQRTWQFIIILDKTWGFHPHFESSLSFTINSPTLSRTHTFSDLILGFTTNNNEYVSMLIPMDNAGGTNKIYPNCLSTNENSPFAVGDIAAIPYSDRDCDLAGGSCNNWRNMADMQPDTDVLNKFPITVTLINNPHSNTLFLSFQSQHCTFINLPLNEGLKIYFAGNDPEERLIIDSFDVKYGLLLPSMSPTAYPTMHSVAPSNIPTTTPTISPSNVPTLTPTLHPTLSPAVAPTNTPSNMPTLSPALRPTMVPTNTPSDAPILPPTFLPSIRPTLPTKTPTVSPTSSPTLPAFECGDSDNGFLANQKTITFPLQIPYDLDRLVIDTCAAFTDFNTTLTLFNGRHEMVAFDSDGCGGVVGKSKIVVNNVVAGRYDILLKQGGRNIEGLYRISISCNIPGEMFEFCSMFGPLRR